MSEEEEEPTQKKGIVVEQGKVGTNKPKKLGDLFASETPKQAKTGIKKPYDGYNSLKLNLNNNIFSKDKRPQTASTGAKVYQGDVKKPTFSNSKGTQNKDTPLTGATVKATEKPQFSNTKGVQNKEGTYSSTASTIKTADKPQFTNSTGAKNKEINVTATTTATEKVEAPKRFVGSLNKAAEENSKIKAPTKDYLEGDNKTKYKGEESTIEIEKPKFLSKNVEGAEPHFKDITKNEDVSLLNKLIHNSKLFLKKLTETPSDIQNVYSEQRTDKDRQERQDRPKRVYKDYKDKDGKEREHREYKEPREYRERKQEKEDEVKYDSDGFEIVATVKTKPEDFKPKRKNYENRNHDKNDKDRKPYQKKPYQKRDKSAEKNEKVEETNEAVVEKTEEKETPKVKKADKATVVIDKSKKLKDLF